MAAALTLTTPDFAAQAQTSNSTPTFVQPTADLSSRRLTPEALWSMGRIGDVSLTPDGKQAFYSVTYYSIEKNKSQSIIRTCPTDGSQTATTSPILVNAYSPTVLPGGQRIAYMSAASGTMQVWSANLDGSDARQMSDEAEGIDGYRFSPDGSRVILVKSVPQHHSIAAKEPDLPLSSGMVINDLMYKHWDQYVTA
ncbi:MAG: peptidase S9, partial [Alloprevotella sp.]|nr:peptidase S9 [Alloprevotella sp.]